MVGFTTKGLHELRWRSECRWWDHCKFAEEQQQKRNATQLLIDSAHNLAFRGDEKGVPSLNDDLHQILLEVAASQIQKKDKKRMA